MFKIARQIISLVVCLSFITHDCSFTFAQDANIAQTVSKSSPIQRSDWNLQRPSEEFGAALDHLKIPSDFGEVVEKNVFQDRPVLFIIEDIHCNPEAQAHIRGILKTVSRAHPSSNPNSLFYVFSEAAEGRMDMSFFDTFPDKKALQIAQEKFLQRSDIDAVESFLITEGPDKAQGLGIEDLSVYVDNIDAMGKSLEENTLQEQAWQTSKEMIEALEKKVFSKGMYDWMSKVKQYRETRTDIQTYFKELSQQYKETFGKDVSTPYPTLKNYADLVQLESQVNPEALEKEYLHFLEILEAKLPKEESTSLLRHVLEYRLGQVSDQEHYLYLSQYMNRMENGSSTFQNLKLLMDQMNLMKNLSWEKLDGEMKEAEEELTQALIQNDQERELIEIQKNYAILDRVARLEGKREDIEAVYRHSSSVDRTGNRFVTEFVAKLKTLYLRATKDEQRTTAFESPDFGDVFKTAAKFYEKVLERDHIFLDKSLALISEKKINHAALVAGGFHTSGLKELLKEAKIGYWIISPRVSHPDDRSLYFRKMEELFGLLGGAPGALKTAPLPTLLKIARLHLLGMQTTGQMGREMIEASNWNHAKLFADWQQGLGNTQAAIEAVSDLESVLRELESRELEPASAEGVLPTLDLNQFLTITEFENADEILALLNDNDESRRALTERYLTRVLIRDGYTEPLENVLDRLFPKEVPSTPSQGGSFLRVLSRVLPASIVLLIAMSLASFMGCFETEFPGATPLPISGSPTPIEVSPTPAVTPEVSPTPGVSPTPAGESPTPEVTPTPTSTEAPTPSATQTPEPSEAPSPTPVVVTPTPEPSPTPAGTPEVSPTPAGTPEASPTPAGTPEVTPTPTEVTPTPGPDTHFYSEDFNGYESFDDLLGGGWEVIYDENGNNGNTTWSIPSDGTLTVTEDGDSSTVGYSAAMNRNDLGFIDLDSSFQFEYQVTFNNANQSAFVVVYADPSNVSNLKYVNLYADPTHYAVEDSGGPDEGVPSDLQYNVAYQVRLEIVPDPLDQGNNTVRFYVDDELKSTQIVQTPAGYRPYQIGFLSSYDSGSVVYDNLTADVIPDEAPLKAEDSSAKPKSESSRGGSYGSPVGTQFWNFRFLKFSFFSILGFATLSLLAFNSSYSIFAIPVALVSILPLTSRFLKRMPRFSRAVLALTLLFMSHLALAQGAEPVTPPPASEVPLTPAVSSAPEIPREITPSAFFQYGTLGVDSGHLSANYGNWVFLGGGGRINTYVDPDLVEAFADPNYLRAQDLTLWELYKNNPLYMGYVYGLRSFGRAKIRLGIQALATPDGTWMIRPSGGAEFRLNPIINGAWFRLDPIAAVFYQPVNPLRVYGSPLPPSTLALHAQLIGGPITFHLKTAFLPDPLLQTAVQQWAAHSGNPDTAFQRGFLDELYGGGGYYLEGTQSGDTLILNAVGEPLTDIRLYLNMADYSPSRGPLASWALKAGTVVDLFSWDTVATISSPGEHGRLTNSFSPSQGVRVFFESNATLVGLGGEWLLSVGGDASSRGRFRGTASVRYSRVHPRLGRASIEIGAGNLDAYDPLTVRPAWTGSANLTLVPHAIELKRADRGTTPGARVEIGPKPEKKSTSQGVTLNEGNLAFFRTELPKRWETVIQSIKTTRDPVTHVTNAGNPVKPGTLGLDLVAITQAYALSVEPASLNSTLAISLEEAKEMIQGIVDDLSFSEKAPNGLLYDVYTMTAEKGTTAMVIEGVKQEGALATVRSNGLAAYGLVVAMEFLRENDPGYAKDPTYQALKELFHSMDFHTATLELLKTNPHLGEEPYGRLCILLAVLQADEFDLGLITQLRPPLANPPNDVQRQELEIDLLLRLSGLEARWDEYDQQIATPWLATKPQDSALALRFAGDEVLDRLKRNGYAPSDPLWTFMALSDALFSAQQAFTTPDQFWNRFWTGEHKDARGLGLRRLLDPSPAGVGTTGSVLPSVPVPAAPAEPPPVPAAPAVSPPAVPREEATAPAAQSEQAAPVPAPTDHVETPAPLSPKEVAYCNKEYDKGWEQFKAWFDASFNETGLRVGLEISSEDLGLSLLTIAQRQRLEKISFQEAQKMIKKILSTFDRMDGDTHRLFHPRYRITETSSETLSASFSPKSSVLISAGLVVAMDLYGTTHGEDDLYQNLVRRFYSQKLSQAVQEQIKSGSLRPEEPYTRLAILIALLQSPEDRPNLISLLKSPSENPTEAQVRQELEVETILGARFSRPDSWGVYYDLMAQNLLARDPLSSGEASLALNERPHEALKRFRRENRRERLKFWEKRPADLWTLLSLGDAPAASKPIHLGTTRSSFAEYWITMNEWTSAQFVFDLPVPALPRSEGKKSSSQRRGTTGKRNRPSRSFDLNQFLDDPEYRSRYLQGGGSVRRILEVVGGALNARIRSKGMDSAAAAKLTDDLAGLIVDGRQAAWVQDIANVKASIVKKDPFMKGISSKENFHILIDVRLVMEQDGLELLEILQRLPKEVYVTFVVSHEGEMDPVKKRFNLDDLRDRYRVRPTSSYALENFLQADELSDLEHVIVLGSLEKSQEYGENAECRKRLVLGNAQVTLAQMLVAAQSPEDYRALIERLVTDPEKKAALLAEIDNPENGISLKTHPSLELPLRTLDKMIQRNEAAQRSM
ncbi:MAG: hypothetical protein HYS08_04965 [Chlamydiae bacterium]|nr:hypothetical protein [Chlamydiota bacterium]MBI3267102.1 hypothetical protein [Chlamydiota bacterium]